MMNTGPFKCPDGDHNVFVQPNGDIPAHAGDDGQLCTASEMPYTKALERHMTESAEIEGLRKELAEQAAEVVRLRAKFAASENMAAILQAELVKAESERRSATTALGVVRCVVGPLRDGESLPDAIRNWRKRAEGAEAGWAKSRHLTNLIYEQLRQARGKA